MREHTVWHVSITSHVEHSYTQKRRQYFASVELSDDDGILSSLHRDEDEDSSLCLTGRGSFALKSLAMCSHDWTVQSGFGLERGNGPQLERSDQLHVIGRVETQLAVVEATFAPALLVLILQLRQLIAFIDKTETETCSRRGRCKTDLT